MVLNDLRKAVADVVAPEGDDTPESESANENDSRTATPDTQPPEFALENGGAGQPIEEVELDRAMQCSPRELKKQILIHEQQLRRRSTEFSEYVESYREHLETAHQLEDGFERQTKFMYAKAEKYKARNAELRKLETMKNLQLWHIAKVQRDLKADWDYGWNTEVGAGLGFEPKRVQQQIDRVRAEIQASFELLNPSPDNTGASDDVFNTERQNMEKLADGKLDMEEIKRELAAVPENTSDEIQMDEVVITGIKNLEEAQTQEIAGLKGTDPESVYQEFGTESTDSPTDISIE